MPNTAYARHNINEYMRRERIRANLSQEQIGKLVGRTQRQVSDIENGYVEPAPAHMVKWFAAIEAYEHIDLVHYLYNLHPLAGPPVDPRLNNNLPNAILNLHKQMRDVLQRFDELLEWQIERRPGKARTEVNYEDWKQIYDLYRSVQTIFYAATREIGLDIQKVINDWANQAISDQVAMPRIDEAREEVAV